MRLRLHTTCLLLVWLACTALRPLSSGYPTIVAQALLKLRPRQNAQPLVEVNQAILAWSFYTTNVSLFNIYGTGTHFWFFRRLTHCSGCVRQVFLCIYFLNRWHIVQAVYRTTSASLYIFSLKRWNIVQTVYDKCFTVQHLRHIFSETLHIVQAVYNKCFTVYIFWNVDKLFRLCTTRAWRRTLGWTGRTGATTACPRSTSQTGPGPSQRSQHGWTTPRSAPLNQLILISSGVEPKPVWSWNYLRYGTGAEIMPVIKFFFFFFLPPLVWYRYCYRTVLSGQIGWSWSRSRSQNKGKRWSRSWK